MKPCSNRRQVLNARNFARRLGRAILVVGWLLGTLPALAAGSPGSVQDRFIVRGFGLGLFPVDDQVDLVSSADGLGDAFFTYGVDDGSGFGLGLEVLVNRRFGIEATASFAELDNLLQARIGEATLNDVETVGFDIFTLGVNYHFTPSSRWDVHAGVFIGMSKLEDVIFLTEIGRRDKLTFDDDIGFGLNVGVDVPFRRGSGWRLSFGLRYLSTILESENPGEDLDLDPFMPYVGIGFRF